MTERRSPSDKGTFTADVSSNKQIGEHFYKLRLEFSGRGAKTFARFQPGQFVQLDASGLSLPAPQNIPSHLTDRAQRSVLLRRPFSFSDLIVHKSKTVAELLYCVVGPATLRMTTLADGDTISVIGPLGNGFSVPKGKRIALLVGGGMGSPPLQLLAKMLRAQHADVDVFAFAGAKRAAQLPFEGQFAGDVGQSGRCIPEFAGHVAGSTVATDDGSAGFSGLVTDCLGQWLRERKDLDSRQAIIFSCGPEPMLAQVARIAAQHEIDCQLSMERRMACGIALCQSCAIECKAADSDDTIYKLCCEDGPVFDAREVVFKR